MKFLLNLLGIGVAAGLGYMLEPDLRPLLAGKTPTVDTKVAMEEPAIPPAEPVVSSPPLPLPEEIPPVAGGPVEPAVIEPPAPVAPPEPEPVVTPVPEPAVAEIPKLPIEPIVPPVAGEAPATPLVLAMQESIRNKQVTEFTFEQVKEWKDAADEVVDGATYQTGVITYEAETFLGMKLIQAKALLKDGKVARWVGLKSGVEIK